MKRLNWYFLIIFFSGTFLMSCDKDDDMGIDPPAVEPDDKPFYSLGTVVNEVSYILTTDDLENGEVSPIGNGVEFGAPEFIASGEYIYFFSRADKKFFQYQLNSDGSITEVASLLVTEYITDRAYSQNLIGDHTLLIMDPVQWGEPEIKWFTISIPDFTVSSSGSFDLPTIEQTAGVNWKVNVGRGALHGDKFVMGTVYYDFDLNFAEGTHAIVLDYPSMENPTLIETKLTTAELGIFTNNSFITTESGDLYIAGYRGFYGVVPDDNVHGVVFRIKAGEYEFDEDYLLDLTDVQGESTQIMQLDFLEGEIGMGMLVNDDDIGTWDNLDNDHYTYARIDLPNQTIQEFNMPKSDIRLNRKPLIEDGKYVTFIKSAANSTTNVLEIEYNGGADAVTIGANITGDNVIGYSIAKHPTE